MKPLGDNDPARVGRYTLVAELGKGAMGRVLLGHAPDGTLVALKLMRSQFTEDDGFRARFAREVEASRKVSNAYTATILEAGPDAPTPWFASTYEPGPSLREAVNAAGPLPEDAALRLAAGLASALVEIHRLGLVHRDLKPSNVLLTERGPKVIDFGIARATDTTGGTDITHTGWLVGTPGYMSPEQAEGEAVEAISDVFSLGSVLAMACTGVGPFDRSSAPQTLYRVVHTNPDLRDVPPRIRAVIEMCLEKDPRKRPGPERILAAIGTVPPSASAWPQGIRDLITAQDAALRQILAEAGEGTTLLDDGATLRFQSFSEGRATPPPPNASRQTWAPPSGPPVPGLPPMAPKSANTSVGAVLATLAAIALVILIIAINTGDSSADDDDGGTSASDDETTSFEDPYTPPEDEYTPPENDYTPPEEEPFDYDTLNDEDTDETPMTASALLPESFEDFTQWSGNMHDCDDAAFDDTPPQDALDGNGCDEIAIGTYVDEDEDIVVALMVMPLSDDGAAEAAYDRAQEGYTDDWTMWCPKKPAAGWRPCVDDTSYAANVGRIGAQYRYLMMARAFWTDLGEGGESALTDATVAAIDAVVFGE